MRLVCTFQIRRSRSVRIHLAHTFRKVGADGVLRLLVAQAWLSQNVFYSPFYLLQLSSISYDFNLRNALSTAMTSQTTEGDIAFSIPSISKDCKTWYQIHGPHPSTTSLRPLLILHGGPGIPHNYLLPLTDLATTHSIPLIFYDQIGCGRSTHLPEKKHDAAFWTVDLFLRELDNLLTHLSIGNNYDLLGQSWGGILGACHAIRQPPGLKNLIIANSPTDMGSWLEAANRLRSQLPEDVQEVLNRCEREGDEASEEYEKAMMVFYERHVCRVVPMPGDLQESFRQLKEDSTVYLTM
ncbi:MAG: hypothetical protein LQ343_005316 [Gyalolechia ehrenbergii]|nr:MAG: hypothetical protein LQ343_005316 [Gyalolechia ehrenbergii]